MNVTNQRIINLKNQTTQQNKMKIDEMKQNIIRELSKVTNPYTKRLSTFRDLKNDKNYLMQIKLANFYKTLNGILQI